MVRRAAIAMLALCSSVPAIADDFHVCSTVAFKAVAEATGKAFAEAEHLQIAFHFGPAGPVSKRVSDDEACDVALLATPVLKQLATNGKIDGDVAPLAQTGIGIAGLASAPPVALANRDDFIAFLRAVGPVGMTDPANGGAVSIYMAALLAKPDFPPDVKAKIQWFPVGQFPKALETGEVKYWITQISEITAATGIRLMAEAPPGIQSMTVISGAVAKQAHEKPAAARYLTFIRNASDILKSYGMSQAN